MNNQKIAEFYKISLLQDGKTFDLKGRSVGYGQYGFAPVLDDESRFVGDGNISIGETTTKPPFPRITFENNGHVTVESDWENWVFQNTGDVILTRVLGQKAEITDLSPFKNGGKLIVWVDTILPDDTQVEVKRHLPPAYGGRMQDC